ncbi:MAG TPA: ester cyclase [Candidatus Sulfotelmatobacter sp.]
MADSAVKIHRWFEEVWNQGREATINEMCSPNAIGYGQAQHGTNIIGPEHFKQFWRSFRDAFSNIHVEIHDTIEQGDRVVIRWTMSMTHSGTFLGIPQTNRQVSVDGISIQRFADGKIIEAWDKWDQLSLLVQLGAVPEPKLL